MNEQCPGGPAHEPVDWVGRELDRLREVQPCDIDLLEWLGGGKSGSRVAVVVRSGPGFDDKVAIKFARLSEHNNWLNSIKDCPEKFLKQHLVDFESALPPVGGESDWWIIVLKVAGGDLALFRPAVELESLRGKPFAAVCETIVSSIIADWNPPPRSYSLEKIPPADYLNSIFDSSRVTPGKPLRNWIDSLDIDPSDVLIDRPAWRILPNPLALASTLSSDLFPDCGHLRVLCGRAHGDLHLRNVLMPVRPPQPRRYKLIDLGGYDPKSPLARDPMHLLLSIATEWLNGGIVPGSQLSHSLINVIVCPRDKSSEKEYQAVSQAIHAAGYSWAAGKSLGDEWTRQSLLSLVGCGMRYASRQTTEVHDIAATRGWFFDLAAVAARAYLQDVGLWDRYSQAVSSASAPRPRRSGFLRAAEGRSSPRTFSPDGQASNPGEQASMSEAEEASDAQILRFRASVKRSDRNSLSSGRPQEADDQGEWRRLADALRHAIFDPADWRSLAADTDMLLRQLRRVRPPHPGAEEDISRHLRRLDQTLTSVFTPSASRAELRSACTRADIIRRWLLDLLAESGR
jgi:hypothetical protein